MTRHEPDEDRSGWSLLGFLRSVLRKEPDFRRLLTLVLVLILGGIVLLSLVVVALDKINVVAMYGHLTQHAPVWESGGVTSGGISFFFGAWKYFAYRKAKKKAKKALTGNGTAGKPGAKKPSDQGHYLVGDSGCDQG